MREIHTNTRTSQAGQRTSLLFMFAVCIYFSFIMCVQFIFFRWKAYAFGLVRSRANHSFLISHTCDHIRTVQKTWKKSTDFFKKNEKKNKTTKKETHTKFEPHATLSVQVQCACYCCWILILSRSFVQSVSVIFFSFLSCVSITFFVSPAFTQRQPRE